MERGKDFPNLHKQGRLWNIQENIVVNWYILKAMRELRFVNLIDNFVN